MEKRGKRQILAAALVLLIAAVTAAAVRIAGKALEKYTPETNSTVQTTVPAVTRPPATVPATLPSEEAVPTEPARKYLIVIDPGHQRRGNYDTEPIGPGASQTKAKVTSGTQGRFTGLEEYVLNLQVSLLLRDILLERGYEVVMIRTDHDVDISNSQRAALANELQADVFIRIHANGSEDPNISGMMTICQTPDNPYNGYLYGSCRLLSELVLEEMVASTGGKRQYVWETDTMSGINWCSVPVTIVEMGYMTNEAEDRLMATPEYQLLLAEGIAKGIDRYFDAISG